MWICSQKSAGGGYHHLSTREAIPVSNKFLSLGYNTTIVYYSVAPHANFIQEEQANLVIKELSKIQGVFAPQEQNKVKKRIFDISNGTIKKTYRHIREIMVDSLKELEDLKNNDIGKNGKIYT